MTRPRLSAPQRRALETMAEGALTAAGLSIYRIQQRIADQLQDAGLARWQPYAKPEACWRITAAGRAAVKGDAR